MENFSTKQKGDLAEYRVTFELLRLGLSVLRPVGDRLPYDLAVDHGGKLLRIQVKMAWEGKPGYFSVDTRRSQTNRRVFRHTKYMPSDFEFLIAWIPSRDVFYVFPSAFACTFSGPIHMSEKATYRKKPPRSAEFRNRWDLIGV